MVPLKAYSLICGSISGKATSVKLLQPPKANAPIASTLSGITILVIFRHFPKDQIPIFFKPCGNSILLNSQFSKASISISVTFSGIINSSKLEQEKKANFPTLVILSVFSKTTDSSDLQFFAKLSGYTVASTVFLIIIFSIFSAFSKALSFICFVIVTVFNVFGK